MKPSQELKRELTKFIKDNLNELEPDFIDTLDYGTFENGAYRLGVALSDILNDEIIDYIKVNNYKNIYTNQDLEHAMDNLTFLFIDSLTSGVD